MISNLPEEEISPEAPQAENAGIPALEIVKAIKRKRGAPKGTKQKSQRAKPKHREPKKSSKVAMASRKKRKAADLPPKKRGPKGLPESKRLREGDAVWGAKVAKKRAALSMRQWELGEKVGVSQMHVCNIEKGTLMPSPELRERVEAWLLSHVGKAKAKAKAATTKAKKTPKAKAKAKK